MAVVNLEKLQANLMTDGKPISSAQKQVLESTILVALISMFGEMPAIETANKFGSDDGAGNITFYKTHIPEIKEKDFDKVGDLSRFNNIGTTKVQIALAKIIEAPIKYSETEIKMSAAGILGQVQSSLSLALVRFREISILKEEYASAKLKAATQVNEIDLDKITPEELENVMDKMIAKIRKTKDTGVDAVSLSQMVIKLDPVVYQKLLKVKLIISGAPSSNELDFTEGIFTKGKYKGVTIVEDVYMEDAEPTFIGSVIKIGAIGSPWRLEGVANLLMPGESTIMLLNPQVRYNTKAIYPLHVQALINKPKTVPKPKVVDAKAKVVENTDNSKKDKTVVENTDNSKKEAELDLT